jgi:hypothetical protein
MVPPDHLGEKRISRYLSDVHSVEYCLTCPGFGFASAANHTDVGRHTLLRNPSRRGVTPITASANSRSHNATVLIRVAETANAACCPK